MTKNRFFFLFCAVLFGACSTVKESTGVGIPLTHEQQTRHNPICFNHSVLVLDSATYYAAVNSDFLRRFAFSQERQMNGYKGFYLFGKTNYIELFHPKSFDGYVEEEGGIWINLAPLKANYIKNLNWKNLDFVNYESNDHFYDLSLIIRDSINPIATWEMTKVQYESWTKKKYNDSIEFLPFDYNSPQDSDSSTNYTMNDVIGIGLSVHPVDSLAIVDYLKVVGFETISAQNGLTRISNNDQFIELHFSESPLLPTINRYFIRLNKSVEPTTEIIGHSRIECDGKLAIWYFER